jgi:hypothetical protein
MIRGDIEVLVVLCCTLYFCLTGALAGALMWRLLSVLVSQFVSWSRISHRNMGLSQSASHDSFELVSRGLGSSLARVRQAIALAS